MEENIINIEEPKKEEKKNNKKIILFVFIILLVLIGVGIAVYFLVIKDNKQSKKEEKEQSIITQLKAIDLDRHGKQLTMYSSGTNEYKSYRSEKPENVLINKEFKITCVYNDCEEAHSFTDKYILIKDGDYLSVYDDNDNIYAYDIGKELVEQGNTISMDPIIRKFPTGEIYVALNVDNDNNDHRQLAIYNINNGKRSQLFNSNNWCLNSSGCKEVLYDLTNYYFVSDSVKNKTYAYDITNMEIKYEMGYSSYKLVGVYPNYYFAMSDYDDTNKIWFAKLYDLKGKLLMDNLTTVKQFNDYIFVEENNTVKRYDSNLKYQKELPDARLMEVGRNFVLVVRGKKLELFDSDFNYLVTLTETYDKSINDVNIPMLDFYDELKRNILEIQVIDYSKSEPDEEAQYGIVYSYNPETKELTSKEDTM